MPNFEQTSPHSPDDARRRLIAENLRYHEEKRLKLEDLRGVYGEDEVRKDAQLVLECDRRFERIGEGEEGKVAEALFHKNVNSGARMFGARAKATLLSAYDDYGLSDPGNREERGAWSDAVIELFPDKSEMTQGGADPYRFVAGIDVTANTSPQALTVKLLGIKTALDTGRLPTVKYFKSEEPTRNYRYAGALKQIPKAVVALDQQSLWRFAELTGRAEAKEKGAQELLSADPIARVALAELLIQFDAFREYAKRSAQGEETARKFDDGVARVKMIMQEKKLTVARLSDRAVVQNPAFRELAQTLLKNNFRVRAPSDIG